MVVMGDPLRLAFHIGEMVKPQSTFCSLSFSASSRGVLGRNARNTLNTKPCTKDPAPEGHTVVVDVQWNLYTKSTQGTSRRWS